MYGGRVKSLTEEVLSHISEYDIFRYYAGDFTIGKTFCSPLRADKNPSFTIFYSPGTKWKLRFKDFSRGISGSCFDFVMLKFGCDFVAAVKIIKNDFGLGRDFKVKPTQGHLGIHYPDIIPREIKQTIIETVRRDWNATNDKSYWTQYGISCSSLKLYQVYPIEIVWLNGNIIWTETKNNPIYGYYFGLNERSQEQWKIVRPYQDNKSNGVKNRFKWIANCGTNILQGYDQLPRIDDKLIITKGMKDVICLYEMGIPAVAPHSESCCFSEEMYKKLQKRFNKIYILFDNDDAGKLGAEGYRDLFGTEMIFIPEEKDISDYIKRFGMNKGKELINDLLSENRERKVLVRSE